MQNRDEISGASLLSLSKARESSESLLRLDHGTNTVDHILDELLLRAAETSLVRDVVSAVIGLGMLTVDTSDLDVVLVGDRVELVLLLAELGKLDVHGSTHGGTKIRGARSDVSKFRRVSEVANGLDGLGSTAESVEDLGDTGTLLHGNNSELILLVDPDQERLGFVVENSTAAGPVTVKVASSEETVTLPKF